MTGSTQFRPNITSAADFRSTRVGRTATQNSRTRLLRLKSYQRSSLFQRVVETIALLDSNLAGMLTLKFSSPFPRLHFPLVLFNHKEAGNANNESDICL